MKNQLQEYCVCQGLEIPLYEGEYDEEGRTYTSMVAVNGLEYFGVSFPSKKMAEDYVAEVALASLGVLQT